MGRESEHSKLQFLKQRNIHRELSLCLIKCDKDVVIYTNPTIKLRRNRDAVCNVVGHDLFITTL